MRNLLVLLAIVLSAGLIVSYVSAQENGRITIDSVSSDTESVNTNTENRGDAELDFTEDKSGEPDMTRQNQSTQGFRILPGWSHESAQFDFLSGLLYIGSDTQHTEIPASVMPPEMERREFQDGPKVIRFKGIAK